MKVLHINTSDISGGAARAAYRIHCGLRTIGVDSNMFVQSKLSDSPYVYTYDDKISKLKAKINNVCEQCINNFIKPQNYIPWSSGKNIFSFVDYIRELKPDIINLHWINSGHISIEDIANINVPIVWTLHDMWAFTGGCHYVADDCKKYSVKCFKCDLLSNQKLDFAEWIFKRKLRNFSKDIAIVTPSEWLAIEAKKSILFKANRIEVIHNCIDTDTYSPKNKKMAREIIGLPINSHVILFGAMSATSDPRKGFHYLYSAIRQIYERMNSVERSNICIAIFGGSEPKNKPDFGFMTRYIGQLNDDISLSMLYSAADVMVVPSHAENYPNTILESMSCGTPCVGFDIGGIPDFITHKENGYLARHYDISDLANGIEYLIHDSENWQKMSSNSRNMVKKFLNLCTIASQYKNLYESILFGT